MCVFVDFWVLHLVCTVSKCLIQLLKGQSFFFLSLRSQTHQRSQNFIQVIPSASGWSKSFHDFSQFHPQTLVFVRQPHLLRRGRGGEGEPVSGGSTFPRSSLDQGPRLDMNMGRSSPWTAQPVTPVQNGLTDGAFVVSLAALWMSFMARVEGKRVVVPFFLFWVWQVRDRLLSVRSFHFSFPCWRLPPAGSPILSISLLCLLSFKELTEAIASLQFSHLCFPICTSLNQSTPRCFLLCS